MMRNTKPGKITLIAILFLILSNSTPNCLADTDTRVVKLQGGTDYGYPGPFSFYSRGPGYYKMALIFDTLIERTNTEYIPWLATSWETSEDGLTWTFHLRNDVKWSDGEAFTADDIVFTYNYYKVHPFGWADLTPLESVEKIDDYTITFTTYNKTAPLLTVVIESQQIIPKHIWETVEDPLTYHQSEPEKAVIGTGPYTLEAYDSAAGTYLFKAKEDYWYGKPAVDEIQFNPIGGASSLEAFLAGELSTCRLDADSIQLLPEQDNYAFVKTPAIWGYKLYFNMVKRPELASRELRQALGYAIDRQEIVDRVGLGLGLAGNPGYLPKSHAWCNPDVLQYDYDPEMAESLIQGLGYVKGADGYYSKDGETLRFTLLTGTDTYLTIAEEIKDDLEAVGVKVTINSVESKTKDSLIQNNDYELAINGHGGWGGDPDLLRQLFTDFMGAPSAFSIQGLDLPDELHELLEAQLIETDEATRKEMVYRIQEIMAEELLVLPIWNTQSYFVYNSDVHDGWYFPFNHHVAEHPKLSYVLSGATSEAPEPDTTGEEPKKTTPAETGEPEVEETETGDSGSKPGFPIGAIVLGVVTLCMVLVYRKRA